ncbi:MAG: hypothetical protein RB191_18685 [Terriglobia bacterium]|nr:hypothetical protein [Terriglobia bacterium]
MNTRAITVGDRTAIAEIHRRMGLDYRMPDLDAPMVYAGTLCEENGKIVGATILKMQAETYLWISPEAGPTQKWDAIRLMQRDILRQAIGLGIEQLVAYVPNCVRFSRRLLRLGWERQRDGWRAWAYEVKR